ncbi:hypothetical protein [Neorhizobium alkalisoli]|uniref:Uncharacterized protein n=1 Tax=Neorhizobium alkalisoli TaxID=528178 RepID=A0A561QAY1_9HYPH|nr:hypothetical protein [Neorhizobium alkalisoli]TWF47528.1 hypothetical protein FHW37_11129 [Neorhizobium alkalisoli]
MANQGGNHEQHVKAGQQSHKNQDSASRTDKGVQASKAAAGKDSAQGKQGGSHEQHVKAGQQSHKNSH